MNYADQSRFIRTFRVVALASVAVLAASVAGAFAMELARTTVRIDVVVLLLAAAVVYALWYLPLYLRLSVESRKRYAWSFRARYVLVVVLSIATVPLTRISRAGGAGSLVESAHPWLAWIVAIVVAAASVSIARRHFRRNREMPELPLVPALLLAGDLAIVMLGAGLRPATPIALVVALALAACINGLTSSGAWQWIGFVAALVADVLLFVYSGREPFSSVVLFLPPAVAGLAAIGLARLADRRHSDNVRRTVDDLAAFTLTEPDEALELLATSTGILARSWNDTQPLGPDAVAKWYSDNSEYYLYDLAQFHLAYKHIAFMRDVISLAKGRVLDFGAGIGDLALELARIGHDTTYVDVDGKTKAFAQWRAERDWIPLKFSSGLDEIEGQFDTIVSLDVFEHLAEPEPVIDDLVERLAPGGLAIFTAYFGATKAHPMHFDHDIDLHAYLSSRGLEDVKTLAMRTVRSEILRKSGVLVFEKP